MNTKEELYYDKLQHYRASIYDASESILELANRLQLDPATEIIDSVYDGTNGAIKLAEGMK